MVQHSALCLVHIAMTSTSKPSVSGGDRGFSSCSQRPPVPGEEDDRCQLDVAAATKKPATRCNGLLENPATSERLNQSNIRSFVSQRQQTSLPISGAGRGGHSVPKLDCCRESPPLGFEPEGSACASPRFKENSSSASSTGGGGASYLRWAESLKLLLQDSEGVRLFKLFLEQEQGCSAALDFWFACTGLKMVADDQDHVASLAKMIYRRYVKGDRLRLTVDVRRRVVEKLRQHQIDPTMFDEAQAEVEYTMRCDDYPLFLKSDTYLQYVQSGSDSPHAGSCNTSNSNANATTDRTNLNDSAPITDCIVRPLPTLAEDEELASDDIRHATVASSLSLTPSALFATRRSREAVASSSYAGISFPKCSYAKLTNPYHISYAPVSAQDSELQSLSSDALTDDTMSYTDSSVDGRERAVYTNKRKQLKAIRRNADVNQQTDLNQPLIPRTERVPPDSNLAESDPKKFASLLTEKLQRVKEEQDKLDRMTTSLRSIDAMDASCISEASLRSAAGNNALNNSVDSFPYTSMLLRSVLTDRDGDDNAQSILEEHVSRVWESSNGPTPGCIHSPGARTPNHHHGPGRTGAPTANLSGFSSKGAAGMAAAVSKSAMHHRVRDEVGQPSSVPFHDDRLSYMVASQLPAARHGGHRHPVGAAGTSQSAIPRDPRQTRASVSRTDIVTSAVVEVDSKRPSARRSLEPAILSNVSRPTAQDPLVSHVPEVTNERVMMWMLDNEKYSSAGKPRCSTDGSDRGSSHKRSSHKSSGSGSGRKGTQQQQQQPVPHPQHRSNRSESLDRSRATSLANNVSMPFHQRPVTHDFPPPHQSVPYTAEDARHINATTTSATSALLKSKSSAGNNPQLMSTSLRDGHLMLPPSSLSSGIPTTRGTQGYDSLPLSSSCEDLSLCGERPERKLAKKPASKATEFTIVGYYFCDEPVPYRTTIPGRSVTLGQFKQHIAKKGNYRYFFKTVCDEFESGVVNEEVTSDGDILPLWEGKVVGKVERI